MRLEGSESDSFRNSNKDIGEKQSVSILKLVILPGTIVSNGTPILSNIEPEPFLNFGIVTLGNKA